MELCGSLMCELFLDNNGDLWHRGPIYQTLATDIVWSSHREITIYAGYKGEVQRPQHRGAMATSVLKVKKEEN